MQYHRSSSGGEGNKLNTDDQTNQYTKSMDEIYNISSEGNSKPIKDQYTNLQNQ